MKQAIEHRMIPSHAKLRAVQASYVIEPLAEEAKKEIHGMIMKTNDVLEAKQRERYTVHITKELMTDAVKVLVNDLGYPESALMDIRNLLSSL